ncbi:MAG: PTS sugar transporter subunit IIA [Deltaproteobacteria bacterium]|nr:PTS sugar transporter subunit IIA [Deltaproteobacteria bacterium]MCK5420804.1 PTS sugar transporter subunit IIA [Deltaproteobacteria bacterium]
MEVKGYIREELINLDLLSERKEDAIRELARLMESTQGVIDFDLFLEDVFERERLGTTGIGDGIAIPHARTDAVDQLVIALGRSARGVEFESLDGKKVKLLFLMGTPKGSVSHYLKILAQLTRLLKEGTFRDKLLEARDKETVVSLFREIED